MKLALYRNSGIVQGYGIGDLVIPDSADQVWIHQNGHPVNFVMQDKVVYPETPSNQTYEYSYQTSALSWSPRYYLDVNESRLFLNGMIRNGDRQLTSTTVNFFDQDLSGGISMPRGMALVSDAPTGSPAIGLANRLDYQIDDFDLLSRSTISMILQEFPLDDKAKYQAKINLDTWSHPQLLYGKSPSSVEGPVTIMEDGQINEGTVMNGMILSQPENSIRILATLPNNQTLHLQIKTAQPDNRLILIYVRVPGYQIPSNVLTWHGMLFFDMPNENTDKVFKVNLIKRSSK